MAERIDLSQFDVVSGPRDPHEGVLSPFTFVVLVLLLTAIGLVCMYSASFPEAVDHGLPHYYFFAKQVVFAVAGISCAVAINFLPTKYYKYAIIPMMVLSLVTMLLTSFTPFGVTVFGARRWLDLPLLPSFQPSEIVKISELLFLSYWLSEPSCRKYLGWYYVVPIITIVVFAALILFQRAYTTTILFLVLSASLLIVGKFAIRWIIVFAAFLAVPAVYLLLGEGYRVRRVASFIMPELDPQGLNWQINMSLSAIREGALSGKGLGSGTYKYGLLPEVQNDFIFANIAEEVGFMGVAAIFVFFAFFAIIGYRSAARMWKKDQFLSLIATGITTMIVAQVIVNVAVVTGMMPPTGIPLPFFSQGGTNLFVILVECGVLYKIISQSVGGRA